MVPPFADSPLLIRTKHEDVLLRPATPQMHTMLWNAAVRTDHKSAARYYAGMSTVSLPAPEILSDSARRGTTASRKVRSECLMPDCPVPLCTDTITLGHTQNERACIGIGGDKCAMLNASVPRLSSPPGDIPAHCQKHAVFWIEESTADVTLLCERSPRTPCTTMIPRV
jgi:hypothetical protein